MKKSDQRGLGSLLLYHIVIFSWLVSPCGATDIPIKRFQMDEVWKVGVEEDDFLFGEVEDLLIDEDGTVFVLDSQLANVKVFSAAGQYIRTIGREGDGPGEVRAPGDLVFMPDGSLGLVSKLNWKIAKIDKVTGNTRGDLRALGPDGDLTMLHQVRGSRNSEGTNNFTALIKESTGQFWHWRMYLGLYWDNDDGQKIFPAKILCDVGEAQGSDIEEEEFFSIWDPWAIDSFGRTVIAPYWGSYTLRYYDVHGELVTQVELPYLQRDRSDKEKKRLLEKVWGGTSPEKFGVDLIISKTEAVVRRIHPRPNGRLWIQTGNSAYNVGDGVFRVYDVVGPDGDLEFKAEIHGHADDLVDKVYFGPGDLIVIVHGAERYVQNHRGLKKNATEYDLLIAGYRLREIADD